MRNFDNWNSYRDLNGHILRGCVQFNVKGGNTQAPIFDRNGTAISNPQITDILGRTQNQVFIDSNVTAYFYKYVGDGTIAEEEAQGIDTSDVSRWALQYTCDNVLSLGSSLESLSPMEIGTMYDLRAIDPESVPNVGGVKEIILGGYYAAGDCEQVRYIWDDASTDADDNGSIIKSNDLLTGRWILVRLDGFVDSRHFGVFPQYSQLANVDHTTRITQFINYCNAAGLNPLFCGSVSQPYFIYGSLNVNSRNAIFVSKGTAFVDKSNSNFYGDWSGNPLFINGRTKVSAHTVRASWNFSDAITYEEFYLDSSTPVTTISDARVIVTVDTAGKIFTNCEIVSDGHLADNTFNNCVLRSSMFVAQDISPTIDAYCTIQPLDFADRMKLWCVLRSQIPYPVVDVCMQTLDASCELSIDGIFIKNALFDDFHHSATLSLGLESCRGSITIVAEGNYVLTAEDSEIVLTTDGTGEVGQGFQPSFNIRNCTIGMQTLLTYLSSIGAVGSEISTGGILCGSAALDGCSVSSALTVRGALSLKKCTISANIVHYAVSSPATVEMVGNVLKAHYNLSAANPNTVVNGVWSGNYSSVASPIVIDRTNIDPVDSHHTYVYDGNSGGFLPYSVSTGLKEYTIKHLVSADLTIPQDPLTIAQDVRGGSDSDVNGRPSGKSYPWAWANYFDTIEMFRIGVDPIPLRCEVLCYPVMWTAEGATGEYQYNRVCNAYLGGYFVSGFTFGIQPYWDDMTAAIADRTFADRSPLLARGSLSFSFNNMPAFSDYHVHLELRYECLDKHGR